MKNPKLTFLWQAALIILLGSFITACGDYGYDYSEPEEEVNLDSNLYGTWSHTSDGETTSYTFKSNGTCIQTIYGVDYDWKWMIENGQLKLYVDNGIPAYKTYKIEGNKLYFWVDSMSVWSLPFTKQ